MIGLEPAVQWMAPAPLRVDADDTVGLRRPALLRFATDDFMPALIKLLAERPGDLADHVADARSYRPKPPGASASWSGLLPEIKLYQAVHGHFNFVAASLVCRMPSLPDKMLDAGAREEVGFVLRRLIPSDPGDSTKADDLIEAAWVADEAEGRGWRALPGIPTALAPGEELLPLFALSHPAGPGRTRRIFVGLLPTSSADTFKASGALSPLSSEDPQGTKVDARKDAFATRVLEPLEELRTGFSTTQPPGTSSVASILRKEASAFVLLDFAELLSTHLPAAWVAIQGTSAPPAGPIADLWNFLQSSSTGSGTLRAAILDAWDKRFRILDEADPKVDYETVVDLGGSTFLTATLKARYEAALPPASSDPLSSPLGQVEGSEDEIPKLQPAPGTLFVVRPVFRRPCAPPPADLVGEPSERFTIASFFDLDAPARTVRILLPVKTSIADLRKYPRNVGFVLSDQLREQMCRVTDLKKILAKQMACGDSFDIGLICSFSIPIITIAALMCLMIIVGLMNIVFWWAAFLKICLPIALPGKRT